VIHYHGAPVGCPADAAGRFWLGRHAFVSYADTSQLAVIADACQSFCIDNGAFSAWTHGAKFDWDGYISMCRNWMRHPSLDWCVIPDVIDGDERENNLLIRKWPFTRRSVPVWHMHESITRLQWLARDFDTVAIGSSGQWPHPGRPDWWGRMSKVMDAVCDESGRPRCKLHGLRMLDPQIFSALPLSSADSTNAARNAGNKCRWTAYAPTHTWQRAGVIADRIESHNSAALWSRQSIGDQQCLGF
jgi:hypothetical protein